MTSKPWKAEPGGTQLEAYVGAFGVKTAGYQTTADLIDAAARMFEIEPRATCAEMASAITDLGKKARSERARRNAHSMMAVTVSDAPTVSQQALERMMAESRPQMIDGAPFGVDGHLDVDPAKLLRKVVSAVISAGHASDLHEFPDVLAFFGSRMPSPEELAGHHKPIGR